MRHLRFWIVTMLAGGMLSGCSAQQANTGNRTANTQTTPARSQPSQPSANNSATGHDHAAETSVQRIAIAEAKALVDGGEAVFLDVRQAEAYKGGHIVGALPMPEAEIPSRAATLPKGKKIITYCS